MMQCYIFLFCLFLNILCSIIDHPLSRLLGEYQYSVYMMLQPVGAAVEKAGGLPRLDISLDPETRSSVERSHTPVSGRGDRREEGGDGEDALLELLGEEGGDEEMVSGNWPSPSDRHPAGNNLFDNKLMRLKGELTQEDKELPTHSGSKNLGSENEKFGSSLNTYQSVSGTLDDELSGGPMFNSGPNSSDGVYENTRHFNTHSQHENNSHRNSVELQRNGQYSLATPTSSPLADDLAESADAIDRSDRPQNVYVDLDEISRLKGVEHAEDVQEEGEDGHFYETIDSIFGNKSVVSEGDVASERGVSNGPVSNYDSADGGVLSQPGTGRKQGEGSEEIELDDLVVFNNLPPLVCTAHLGDHVALEKLVGTASAVLSEVVKQVHSSLSESPCALIRTACSCTCIDM